MQDCHLKSYSLEYKGSTVLLILHFPKVSPNIKMPDKTLRDQNPQIGTNGSLSAAVKWVVRPHWKHCQSSESKRLITSFFHHFLHPPPSLFLPILRLLYFSFSLANLQLISCPLAAQSHALHPSYPPLRLPARPLLHLRVNFSLTRAPEPFCVNKTESRAKNQWAYYP